MKERKGSGRRGVSYSEVGVPLSQAKKRKIQAPVRDLEVSGKWLR